MTTIAEEWHLQRSIVAAIWVVILEFANHHENPPSLGYVFVHKAKPVIKNMPHDQLKLSL
jgi:hypothetical protein